MPSTSRLRSTVCGASGWRRAKASSCWVSTAARSALRIAAFDLIPAIARRDRCRRAQPALHRVEAAEDHLQDDC